MFAPRPRSYRRAPVVTASLGNPAFLFTFAVIQAGLLLVGIRLLDVYGRQPLGLVALVAAWGATGAAAISVIGNQAVKGLLSGDVQVVFGDAISAPLVEEAAKGLALLAAVGPVRLLLRRAGVTLFEGAGAGIVYGAAVGLGFGFTEDIYFLVDRARTAGIDAGFETFLYRRDFFGPAILHHAVFTAAFGAGLGLATTARTRARRIGLPLAGYALAVLMHAANDGLVELVLAVKYGIAQTAVWAGNHAALVQLEDTASTVRRFMRVLDFYYLAMFVGAVIWWNDRRGRAIKAQLEGEVEVGLLSAEELAVMFDLRRRTAADWRLLRSGQAERLRHQRRLRGQLAQLGLLKMRTADPARLNRARREIATLTTFDVTDVKLPTPSGPIIGREQQLEEVARELLSRDVRVVTLLGPGGTGKTRLSIEVASVQRDRFAGGAFFVQLAPLTDPDLVPAAIADVLEVQVRPGDPAVAAVAEHLRDKQTLLVLDNFEQVTRAAGSIAEILEAAPRVKVLISSREPLRIRGEHEYPVPPLEGDPAVALFADRAQAVERGFTLTAENAPAVREICRQLDGLPLAIELAAARINVLTPEAMLGRLGSQVLSGGARDLPGRHQALRSTIAWSYDMLPAADKALFARLAVFVDGAGLEAVEAICPDDGGSSLGVIDGLGSLRGKSLLRREDKLSTQPRFAMLATIREYALERLADAGELAQLRERHARWFADLAEEAEGHLVGALQAEWYARLDQEVGNFRAALAWAAEADEPEVGLRIAGALPRFWSMRGIADTSRWMSATLAREGDAVTPAVRAKALFAEGYADLDHGDFAHAERRFAAALTEYRALDDAHGTAASLAQLAFLTLSRGDTDGAVALADESVGLARRADDANVESVALGTLAEVATRARDYLRAAELYEQSLTLRRRLGDRRNIANALLNLGRVALVGGEHARARALLEQGLATAREVDDTWSVSIGLASTGRLALREGRTAEADELLGQALRMAVDRGGRRLAGECLSALALSCVPTAPERAARLLGAAEALRRELGVSASPIEESAAGDADAVARAALGEPAFAGAWHAGLALDLDGAVALALAAPVAR